MLARKPKGSRKKDSARVPRAAVVNLPPPPIPTRRAFAEEAPVRPGWVKFSDGMLYELQIGDGALEVTLDVSRYAQMWFARINRKRVTRVLGFRSLETAMSAIERLARSRLQAALRKLDQLQQTTAGNAGSAFKRRPAAAAPTKKRRA